MVREVNYDPTSASHPTADVEGRCGRAVVQGMKRVVREVVDVPHAQTFGLRSPADRAWEY